MEISLSFFILLISIILIILGFLIKNKYFKFIGIILITIIIGQFIYLLLMGS